MSKALHDLTLGEMAEGLIRSLCERDFDIAAMDGLESVAEYRYVRDVEESKSLDAMPMPAAQGGSQPISASGGFAGMAENGEPAATSTFWKGLGAGAFSLSLGLLSAPWSAPGSVTQSCRSASRRCASSTKS